MSLAARTSAQPAQESGSAVSVGRRVLQRKCSCGTSGAKCDECKGKLHRKLTVGAVNDPLEAEADRFADSVMAGGAAPSTREALPRIQRRASMGEASAEAAPASVDRTLAQSGSALEPGLRRDMEHRFGHDFSRVRIHADSGAAQSARDVNAHAYTVGDDVVFDSGRFAPGIREGRRLLAHELAHVVQQTGSPGTTEAKVQRAKPERLGTRAEQPKGVKCPFKRVSATFNGEDFTLTGDGVEILRAAGQSGRPNTVRATDAKSCGGSPDDSYLNNPRYVGIGDNGPIPEGEYTFLRSEMVTFTATEQSKMALAGAGDYVDPSGLSLHGDWGAGRAALHPVRIVPAKTCGSTESRSGFYLHGGVMPGSSGCIDIGNSAITKVVDSLAGCTGPVTVIVKYTKPPPDVGALDRAAGRFMYPSGKNPSFWDRLKSVAGGRGE